MFHVDPSIHDKDLLPVDFELAIDDKGLAVYLTREILSEKAGLEWAVIS